jgi:chemotaxis protein MotB
MAKKTKFPLPKDDVPAWFVTYSDVVTLLMTFFILLLTFSTMEPEKFDQVNRIISSKQAATGRTGLESAAPADNAWVTRIRPSSSRVAMRGAEMPPVMEAPVKETFGYGLKKLHPDEHTHNELESHSFDIDFNQIIDSSGQITVQGETVLNAVASQLRSIPFQASLQYSEPANAHRVSQLMLYLFEVEKIRPGQLSMTLIRNENLTSERLRIVVKRFLVRPT